MYTASSEDTFVTLESVRSKRHPLLSSTTHGRTGFWIVQVTSNLVAICGVKFSVSGEPERLIVAGKIRADALLEISCAAVAAMGV